MVEYELTFCYGIIVSSEKIDEIRETLTDDAYDELVDNYARCINSWTGGDWFVGISIPLLETDTDSVYHVSDFSVPADDDNDLIDFKQFFNKNYLWYFIDWKPELLLINFCY